MDHEKTPYRIALENAIEQMNNAEDMEQARTVWERFPVLHRDWRFAGVTNKKKKEINNQAVS